jgi:probable DNA repair protein
VTATSDATIVAATAHLARQLRQTEERWDSDAGPACWPAADILTLDEWLRRCWQLAVLRGAPAGSRRLLSRAQSRRLWLDAVLADPGNPLDAPVLAALAESAWAMLADAGLSRRDLASTADTEDSRAFARWAARYDAALGAERAIDSAGALLAVRDDLASGALPAPPAIEFRGFVNATPALTELQDALRRAGTRVDVGGVTGPWPAARLVRATSDEAELASALAWAAAEKARDPRAVVGILVPDLAARAEAVRRAARDALCPGWQLGGAGAEPFSLSVAPPLIDVPLVSTALATFDLVTGEVGFDAASVWLRSPFLAAAESEASARSLHELELRGLPWPRVRLADWAALPLAKAPVLRQVLTRLEQHRQVLVTRRARVVHWAETLAGILDDAGWPGERAPDSHEYQVLDAWQRALDELASLDDWHPELNFPAVLAELRRVLAARRFAPESAPGSVQILSWREAHGQAFSALWICGLSADQWPPEPEATPLLPRALVARAGGPAANSALTAAAAGVELQSVASRAARLVCSHAAEREGARTGWSRHFLALLEAHRQSVDQASVESSSCEVAFRPDRAQIAIPAALEPIVADVAPPLDRNATFRGDTRLLQLQARSPAQAFTEYRLGARAYPRLPELLGPARRGQIVHAWLETLYAGIAAPGGLAGLEAGERRDRALRIAHDTLVRALPGGGPQLRRLRALEGERLAGLAEDLAALDAARWPGAVATEIETEIPVGGVVIALRLDRIDSLAAGGQIVLDYKTGDGAYADWYGARLKEPQVPLYAVSTPGCVAAGLLALRAGGVELRGVAAEAATGTGLRAVGTIRFLGNDAPPADWTELLARWQRQVNGLMAEFTAGDFRVDPHDEGLAASQFATLTGICRAVRDEDDDDD